MRQIRPTSVLALTAIAALTGCPDVTGEQAEAARAAVEEAWAQGNPAGRTGLELRGKHVWLEGPMFNNKCLEQNHLAFNDDGTKRPPGSPPRISPTYKNQRFITASTDVGYCVYLGDDPKLEVTDVSWGGDAWRVSAKVSMGKATKWFECLDPAHHERQLLVTIDDAGKATIDGNLDLFQGACPNPLPGGEERGPGKPYPQNDHAAPSKAEVVKLARALDDALFEGDFEKVQAMTACYNLEDESPHFGNCSVGEFISVGPSFHGEQRQKDGQPWIEYAIGDLDDIQRIVKDKKLKGIYHATMTHKRNKRDRSFAVQWVGGEWKMVGVIGRKAESLTAVRYLYDLHRADKRDVLLRRLEGEEIDENGNSLNPEEEEEE